MTAKEQAHDIINGIQQEMNQREQKVKAIAEKLQLSYQEAQKLVEQELKRREAGKRYRESEAYHKRLEQQKLVRQLMKA